jgi:hypothetical protein
MDTPATAESRVEGGTPHTRYTSCGEPAAEARVAQDLSRLATGIDSELGEEISGLILTGPFARAEGGIVYRDGEPFADAPGYELLAVFRSRHERHVERLDAMAATWSRLLRAPVAIGAFSAHELGQVAATRFWFHVGRGWVITLLGDPALCLAVPRLEPSQLRWQEPVLSQCEGLTALALATLTADGDQSTTTDRMHRAVIACVDALLLRRGRYADTLSARAAALDAVHASALLRAAYRDAVRYCARPDAWLPESGDLASFRHAARRALTDAVVHAEAERLGGARSVLGYVRSAEPLFRDPAALAPSRLQRALRALAVRSRRASWRSDPVERLLRASVALALAPGSPECRACAAEQLAVDGANDADRALAAALRELAGRALTSSRFEHPFARLAYEPHAPPPG